MSFSNIDGAGVARGHCLCCEASGRSCRRLQLLPLPRELWSSENVNVEYLKMAKICFGCPHDAASHQIMKARDLPATSAADAANILCTLPTPNTPPIPDQESISESTDSEPDNDSDSDSDFSASLGPPRPAISRKPSTKTSRIKIDRANPIHNAITDFLANLLELKIMFPQENAKTFLTELKHFFKNWIDHQSDTKYQSVTTVKSAKIWPTLLKKILQDRLDRDFPCLFENPSYMYVAHIQFDKDQFMQCFPGELPNIPFYSSKLLYHKGDSFYQRHYKTFLTTSKPPSRKRKRDPLDITTRPSKVRQI